MAVGVIMDCYCSVITHPIGGSPINTNQPISRFIYCQGHVAVKGDSEILDFSSLVL